MRSGVPRVSDKEVRGGCGVSRPGVSLTRSGVNEDMSPSSCGPREQFGQPDQIEGGAREHHEPVDLREPPEFDLADPADGVQPAERGFDAWSSMLTLGVTPVPGRAGIDRA